MRELPPSMAVEHDRSRTAGLRTVGAGVCPHRRGESMRDVARGAGRGGVPAAQIDSASTAIAWWHGRIGAPWGRIAGPVLRATQSRWMRWLSIGVAAITA